MRYARDIWEQIVRQYDQSGLTQEAFAEQRGIPVGTLRSWIYRLRREQAEEGARLLPVRVVASTAPLARQPEAVEVAGATIEIEAGDPVRVRLPAQTPAAFVAELVSLLRARC